MKPPYISGPRRDSFNGDAQPNVMPQDQEQRVETIARAIVTDPNEHYNTLLMAFAAQVAMAALQMSEAKNQEDKAKPWLVSKLEGQLEDKVKALHVARMYIKGLEDTVKMYQGREEGAHELQKQLEEATGKLELEKQKTEFAEKKKKEAEEKVQSLETAKQNAVDKAVKMKTEITALKEEMSDRSLTWARSVESTVRGVLEKD